MRRIRLDAIAATLAAALVLAGCSSVSTGGAAGSGAAGDKVGSGAKDPSPAASAGTTGAPTSAAATGAPNATGSAYPYPQATPPPGSLDGLYDFVKVWSPQTESWGGADCFPPRPGSNCTVLMQGSAFLATDTKGTIAFLAYENNSAIGKVLLSKPAKRWRNTVHEWVPYKVGRDTYTVTFFVELRNSLGVAVAKSDPMTFPVTAD